jgi:GWxTD domain-containing protein
MNKITLTIIIFVALSQMAFSQNQNRNLNRNNHFIFGDIFFAQTFAMPNSTMDSINILFCYSFIFDGLVFQKTNDDMYFAVPNLEATFRDNSGIIRRRLLTNDTIWTDNFSETTSKTTSFSNISIFTLPVCDYNVSVRLHNGKSSRNITLESKIQGFDSLAKTETILQPFFVQPTDNNEIYFPFLSNNYIPFSVKNFTVFVPVSIPETANDATFSYKIERKEANERGISWGDFYSISGNLELLKNTNFATVKTNNEVQISLISANYVDENYDFALLKVDVSMARFSPANYSINIKNNKTNQERDFDFEVRWNDIPLSLVNPEQALENMYLVLTDSEYKQMKKVNKTELFNSILNYWQQRNPTPTAEYNEAMTEYFRRVDYANSNFQTLTQKDGAKTDRGKVYILNGKPDRIENEMIDRRSREIWTYSKLNQRYIFDLISVGVFRLVKIEE